MIFDEIVKEYRDEVGQAVEELFKNAFQNQKHEQDLLLVIAHACFQKDANGETKRCLGPDIIGHCESTVNQFLILHREAYKLPGTMEEFEVQAQLDTKLKNTELYSINIEKQIYLKFWESEMTLKKIHQLINLANHKNYRWNDLSRELYRRSSFILEKIIKPTEVSCPKFSKLVKDIYNTQIRNSIAHSQYFFMGNNIGYGNAKENLDSVYSLSFKQWAEIIHKTLLVHDYLLQYFEFYGNIYLRKAIDGPLLINVLQEDGTYELDEISPRASSNDYTSWVWMKDRE